MDTRTTLLGRRRLLAGSAGLGLAAIAGVSLAAAQATPEPSDDTTDDTANDTTDDATSTSEDAFLARATERYDEFVTGLAGALSISDTATVDSAIRTSLTAMVDARLAEGTISADAAESARSAIASSPAPLAALLMAGRVGGRGRGHGGPGWGGRDSARTEDETDDGTGGTSDPAASSSPSTEGVAATPAAAL
ncbi:MAG TPA: hypothetical protein VGT61_15705 [Thermomicrobiales bacterium]|jgi:hypothetical protein|nr:hypothetical protein [Thermomicrobiales bacterium]